MHPTYSTVIMDMWLIMQHRDAPAPWVFFFFLPQESSFSPLSLSHSLLRPPHAKQFHLFLSTQSVSICAANLKSGRAD